MDKNFIKDVEVKARKKNFRRRILTILASVVVFCTVYALILPAITMENAGDDESSLEATGLSTMALADASSTPLVTGKTVTYQVWFDNRWITLGSSAYSTGTVNGSTCAYITSQTAENYFGDYGYVSDIDLSSSMEYSYNDIYNIFFNNSEDFLMDFHANNAADNVEIWLYEYNGTDAQKFRIWDAGNGYSFITPLRNSGYHINVYGGGTADGTKLRLRHETDNASRWSVVTNSDGKTTFANAKGASLFIDLPDGKLENKNQLQIWNGGNNRYWRLEQLYEWSTPTAEKNATGGYNIALTPESNGNIICRYTPTLSLGDDIYSVADLVKLKRNGTHRLMVDLTVDSNDAGSYITLKDVTSTLDLNGHTISYNPNATDDNHTFISLGDNANFTVTDNAGKATETVETVETDKVYGNIAQWDANKKYLTYYVTESDVNDDGITRTDTLVKHTVDVTNVGAIESTGPNYPTQLIKVESNSSVLNISDGRFTNPGGQHAILSTAATPTINVSGGYFCGTNSTSTGAALYATGKTTISGGVIAANGALSGGGIYYQGKSGGFFNMTGGVVSGNKINGSGWLSGNNGKGAGITLAMDNGGVTATLSGGYITNNSADYYCGHPGWGDHSGGGIYQNGGNLLLTSDENSEGVFITGNYHKESGGGICFNGQQFTMENGVISANVATYGEGGGIRLNKSGNTALIVGGYITNNYTHTNHDWGGGGIFVVQGNSMQIKNSLISENHARGFGGGVAGCPTGQLIVNGEESKDAEFSIGITALYNNTADGEVLAGSDGVASSKPQDQKAKANQVFMTSGYQDYFCALNSVLSGTMLGDGSENYKGSCDYKPIELKKGEVIAATSMMGMTAYPTQSDIDNGKGAAKVFITGNYSGTHGGGVLSNGLLVLGEVSDVSLKPGLEISMPKVYKRRTDGSTITPEANQFNFLLLDDKVTVNGSTVNYTEENIVERLTNNENGYLSFEPYFPEEVGDTVATYYLLEEPGKSPDVTYDSKVYKIEIGTTSTQEVKTLANSKEITLTYYLVNRVKVSVVGDPNETQVDGYYWDFNNPNSPNNSTNIGEPSLFVRLSLTFKNGFTNTVEDTPVVLKIIKSDGNTDKLMPFISFTLKDSDGNVLDTRSTAGDSGIVTFQLEKNKTYSIEETPPDGYHQYGPWHISVDSNGKATIYEGTDANGRRVEGISFSSTNNAITNAWPLENFSGIILPATGGIGTGAYTVCGSVVVAIALLGFILLKRKRKQATH